MNSIMQVERWIGGMEDVEGAGVTDHVAYIQHNESEYRRAWRPVVRYEVKKPRMIL